MSLGFIHIILDQKTKIFPVSNGWSMVLDKPTTMVRSNPPYQLFTILPNFYLKQVFECHPRICALNQGNNDEKNLYLHFKKQIKNSLISVN